MNNNEMPMDGTEFNAVVVSYIPYRYKLYKPSSNEAKSGIKGRWQRMNDYGGWDNTDTPPTRADKAAPVERIEGLKEAVEFRREIAEFGISRVDNFFGMNKEKPKLSLDTILWIAARAYLKLQGGE